MSGAVVSPMRAVLAEFRAGATSLSDVAHRTGLDRDLVGAVVDRLVTLGYLHREELHSGCPPQGCGGCAQADVAANPCATGPRHSPGPVLLTLGTPPPR